MNGREIVYKLEEVTREAVGLTRNGAIYAFFFFFFFLPGLFLSSRSMTGIEVRPNNGQSI